MILNEKLKTKESKNMKWNKIKRNEVKEIPKSEHIECNQNIQT